MKSALVVWGGWDGHEPRQCAEIFAEWLRRTGVDVTVADTLDAYRDEALMRRVQVVVQSWTCGTITPEQSAGLRNAVLSGVGLAGWHGGLCDAFRNDCDYQFMTGGQFVAHPGGIVPYRVRFVDREDPITRELRDFDITSEQYYMHVDPGNEVQAVTDFVGDWVPDWVRGSTQPAVWKRRHGKGRVFFSALGHVAKDFEVYEAAEVMRRGIQWSAGWLG